MLLLACRCIGDPLTLTHTHSSRSNTLRRMWDYCSHRAHIDLSCGAANRIWRVLALPSPANVAPCAEEPIPQEPQRLEWEMHELLDPDFIPKPLLSMYADTETAACGFVYARGAMRLWANDACAERLFSSYEANQRLDKAGVLPSFIFGKCVLRCPNALIPTMPLPARITSHQTHP